MTAIHSYVRTRGILNSVVLSSNLSSSFTSVFFFFLTSVFKTLEQINNLHAAGLLQRDREKESASLSVMVKNSNTVLCLVSILSFQLWDLSADIRQLPKETGPCMAFFSSLVV